MESQSQQYYDVIVVGGGLSGLVASATLARKGYSVLLLEKKTYPFHKVCGEYVSNEILPLLQSVGFDPHDCGCSNINDFIMSDEQGRTMEAKLDLGGFGLSRYILDKALSEIAVSSGVCLRENCRVQEIHFNGDRFRVVTHAGEYHARFVLAAHGKRDLLDKNLNREFLGRHTGYMGVKYHVRLDYPADRVGLYHFPGGYCGIVKIDSGLYNLCYLYKRNERTSFHDVHELEEKVLFKNKALERIFRSSSFETTTPLVINEIWFGRKECVKEHVLFCGDSAGLITPLCGNGMAMAMHGGYIAAIKISEQLLPGKDISNSKRSLVEQNFESEWKRNFSSRLTAGRLLQKLSGKKFVTGVVIGILNRSSFLKSRVIKSTHGRLFEPVIDQSAHQLHQISHP